MTPANWFKRLSKYWHTIRLSLVLAGACFMAGFFYKYHLPRIENWLLVEIETASEKGSPVRIWPESLELKLLPPAIGLRNVRLLPQKDMAKYLAPTTVGEIEVRLNPISLLGGQIRFSKVKISNATFDIKVPSPGAWSAMVNKGRRSKSPLSFDTIDSLPISSIELHNVALNADIPAVPASVRIDSVDMTVDSQFRSVRADLEVHNLRFQKNGETSVYHADLATNFLLDEEGVYFSELKLARGASYFSASGSVEGNILARKIKTVHADIQADADLKDVSQVLSEIFAEINIPKMRGHAHLDSEVDYILPKRIRGEFALKTDKLTVNQFSIGDSEIRGNASGDSLKILNSYIRNSFGQVDIPKGELAWKDAQPFSFDVKSNRFRLQELFRALNLKKIPVYIALNGDLPCQGQLKSPFSLTCTGKLAGKDFHVNTSVKKAAPEIVSFNEGAVKGSVTVTPDNITYKAHIKIGSDFKNQKGPPSEGDTSGVITYHNGFNIKYSTEGLHFDDIKNLLNLKPEGTVAISGDTKGNSRTATIDLTAHGDGLWLSDYKLGKAQFHMGYRTGDLNFDSISGELNRSHYTGTVALDLKKKQIQLKGSVPFLDSADIVDCLSRRVTLPIAVTGTGTASIKMWGPLQFNQLSYVLDSSIFRGSVDDESFDQLTFNVNSQNGHVKTRNVNIVKGHGVVTMTGTADPSGQIDLHVQGNGLQIEQSENLSRLKMNLTGNVSFLAHLAGPIRSPTVDMQGALTQMTVGDQPAADSQFHFQMDPNQIDIGGDFLGSTIKGDLHTIRGLGGSTHAQFKIANWDFAQSFSAFSDSIRTGSYVTNMTADGDVTLPNKNWRLFSGHISVDQFLLQNGNISMTAKHPMRLDASNGQITTQHFAVFGTNSSYMRLRSSPAAPGQLALSLDGQVDMSLFSLLTPFLDDLRGLGRFSLLLSGPVDGPNLSGSGEITDGLVKLKGFPHALEQMSADVSFNKNKISINTVRGRLAGGLMIASGTVSANGLTNVPVDVKGTFKDARFNVPDGFKTHGSGDFSIQGNWFPYTLALNFDVSSGSIEPKSTSDVKSVPEVKPSAFLPKFLSAQRFTPITLALNINIQRDIPVHIVVNRLDIQSAVKGNLKITGNPQSPLLDGRVLVAKGGKVGFRSNTFEITSATVDYHKSAPTNPSLDVTATTKVTAVMKNNDTRDFDVDLSVQGQASNPKINLRSDPPLSQTDLISLLTLGFLNENPDDLGPTSLSTNDPNSQIANTGAQFGSALLSDSLGINRQIENKLGVHVDVSSSYDTVDQTTKPTITLRKQWNPRFGTSASREIGKTNVNDVSAEYKLNHNLSVLGGWEGRESNGADQAQQLQQNDNVWGLDLQYKLEFK